MSLIFPLFFSTIHIPLYPAIEPLSLPSQTEMEISEPETLAILNQFRGRLRPYT